MSIIAFPGTGSFEPESEPVSMQSQAFNLAAEQACRQELLRPVRRRGSLEQGRALESLGHAVEYLIDSRMFHAGDLNPQVELEAVQILMRMSREVFAECPEVVSLRRRFRRWMSDRFAGDSGMAQRG